MGDAVVYPRMASTKRAAEMFGCSVHFLRTLCRTGQVRYTAVSARRWLVNLDSLAQFFEKGENIPAEQPEIINGTRRIAR